MQAQDSLKQGRSKKAKDWGLTINSTTGFKSRVLSNNSNRPKRYSKSELLSLFKPIEPLPEGFTVWSAVSSESLVEPENFSPFKIERDVSINPDYKTRIRPPIAAVPRGRGIRGGRGTSRGKGVRGESRVGLGRGKPYTTTGESTQTISGNGNSDENSIFGDSKKIEIEKHKLGMNSEWFYKGEGGELKGPFTLEVLRQQSQTSTFFKEVLVKQKGDDEFLVLKQVLAEATAMKQESDTTGISNAKSDVDVFDDEKQEDDLHVKSVLDVIENEEEDGSPNIASATATETSSKLIETNQLNQNAPSHGQWTAPFQPQTLFGSQSNPTIPLLPSQFPDYGRSHQPMTHLFGERPSDLQDRTLDALLRSQDQNVSYSGNSENSAIPPFARIPSWPSADMDPSVTHSHAISASQLEQQLTQTFISSNQSSSWQSTMTETIHHQQSAQVRHHQQPQQQLRHDQHPARIMPNQWVMPKEYEEEREAKKEQQKAVSKGEKKTEVTKQAQDKTKKKKKKKQTKKEETKKQEDQEEPEETSPTKSEPENELFNFQKDIQSQKLSHQVVSESEQQMKPAKMTTLEQYLPSSLKSSIPGAWNAESAKNSAPSLVDILQAQTKENKKKKKEMKKKQEEEQTKPAGWGVVQTPSAPLLSQIKQQEELSKKSSEKDKDPYKKVATKSTQNVPKATPTGWGDTSVSSPKSFSQLMQQEKKKGKDSVPSQQKKQTKPGQKQPITITPSPALSTTTTTTTGTTGTTTTGKSKKISQKTSEKLKSTPSEAQRTLPTSTQQKKQPDDVELFWNYDDSEEATKNAFTSSDRIERKPIPFDSGDKDGESGESDDENSSADNKQSKNKKTNDPSKSSYASVLHVQQKPANLLDSSQFPSLKSSAPKAKPKVPNNNIFGGAEASKNFKDWYKKQVEGLGAKFEQNLMNFLLSLTSDEDTVAYIIEYFGGSEKVRRFAEEFKTYKSFETSSAKDGSSKKKKKGKKIPPELLGFK